MPLTQPPWQRLAARCAARRAPGRQGRPGAAWRHGGRGPGVRGRRARAPGGSGEGRAAVVREWRPRWPFATSSVECHPGAAGHAADRLLSTVYCRRRYYTYPALRLIQVLPGHPLADETVCINTKKDKPMSQQRREQSPRQGSNDSRRSLANTSKQETKRDKEASMGSKDVTERFVELGPPAPMLSLHDVPACRLGATWSKTNSPQRNVIVVSAAIKPLMAWLHGLCLQSALCKGLRARPLLTE